jgi:hypothetical protein
MIALASMAHILYTRSVTARWLFCLLLGASSLDASQKVSTSAELENALRSVKPGEPDPFQKRDMAGREAELSR